MSSIINFEASQEFNIFMGTDCIVTKAQWAYWEGRG